MAQGLVSSTSEFSPCFMDRLLTGLSTFGMSLSYSNSDGSASSASPVVLADSLLQDNVELVVMTDKACSGGDCGYVRPGTVAYRQLPLRFEM